MKPLGGIFVISLKPGIGQMLRMVGVLSAAAVLALPLATMPVAAQRSGPVGQAKPGIATTERAVVFASIDNTGGTGNRSNIYTIKADGSTMVNLTPNNTSTLRDPAWSPNGSTIAYTAPGPLGGRYLYVMKHDGSQPTQVTSGLYHTDSQPTWSPDGLSVAFISDRSGNPQLWTLSLNDMTMSQRTTNAVAPENPSWSPDGARIVYASAGNLYLFNSAMSRPYAFVISGKARTPDWSPDGSNIAYVDGETVWIRSLDGKNNTMVGTYAGASSPRWSLNGAQLTFSARDGSSQMHLYVVDLLGNWIKQVTYGVNDDITPDW
jgi:TolB protein